ncbi:conserved hypothetical protein [Ricinus communis]|uniref:Uncharacterized protein n=1 Tax=Ricinus communis TaxID=3988 RepID=B9SAB4_RICCO|nr:conserved hypothetical protein [Ricinus communis]
MIIGSIAVYPWPFSCHICLNGLENLGHLYPKCPMLLGYGMLYSLGMTHDVGAIKVSV